MKTNAQLLVERHQRRMRWRMKLIDRATQAMWSDVESRRLALAIRKGNQASRERLDERFNELGLADLRLELQEKSHVIAHIISYSFDETGDSACLQSPTPRGRRRGKEKSS
jgi:hypothetical protein